MGLKDEATGNNHQVPQIVDIWANNGSDITVKYVVLPPWQWVMDNIKKENMTELASPDDLPTRLASANNNSSNNTSNTTSNTTSNNNNSNNNNSNNNNANTTTAVDDFTPRTRQRRRAAQKKRVVTSTLKIEVCDPSGENILFAAHGTSAALDGLEDKDELVRTMQRCRCDHKQICPPSVLINWDVTHDECLREVGNELPALEGNKLQEKYVVLKEPMGSQGNGIFFVRSAEEIHDIIKSQRTKAQNDPDFLDNLIAQKGRIPSWVLQAEVHPCLLIKDRRKFHIRTYVVILELLYSPDLLEAFVLDRHEVRIAGVPVPDAGESEGRDRNIHITNGHLTDTTERALLHQVDELANRGLKEKVELFVATTFGKDLVKDMAGRIRMSNSNAAGGERNRSIICKFAVAGLDLMVTEDNRIYLLEVNSNPAAPKEATVNGPFKEHLQDFFHDLTTLVTTGNPPPSFLSANDILDKNGVER